MENETNKTTGLCGCDTAEKIVLACSGASDLGYATDQVARKLSRSKDRKMNCLAVVASCTAGKIEEFRKCDILVIDGCPEDCGKKIMEKAGLNNYLYLRLTDLGYEKGKTPTTQETVNVIYEKARELQ